MTAAQANKTKKIYQIIFILVSVGFVIVFIFKFGELSNTIKSLSKGSWGFIVAAMVLQILAFFNKGAFYYTLYDYFGARDTLKRLILLVLSSNFANLVAPSAGFSGTAIMIGEAEHQGMSKSRAIFVNIFAYFLIYVVFTCVLLFGLFYLFFNHQLSRYIIVSAGVLFGIILMLLVSIFAAAEGAAKVKKLFTYIANGINYIAKFLHRKRVIIKLADVQLLSEEVHECLVLISKKTKGLGLPTFHVLLWEAIDILTLYYLFLAFHYPIFPGTLITVYTIGVLFTLVSITPSGLGIVEATMIVVAAGLKVPIGIATVAVVGYRIFTYWFPFILGYFAFREVQKDKIIRLEHGSS